MKPTPDELVRRPLPPDRSHRDRRLLEREGPSCYFCRSIYNPVRTVEGKPTRDCGRFACDHPDRQDLPLMSRREAIDCCCGLFQEDDREADPDL